MHSTRRLSRRVALAALVVAAALPVPASADPSVPFKASDAGTFVFTSGTCDPGYAALSIDGSGQGTHLGRYAVHADECFDPVTFEFYGTLRITAANGDLIFASYAGVASEDLSGYRETAEITGGTGRFDDLAGTLAVDGVITGPDTYVQTLSGIVSKRG